MPTVARTPQRHQSRNGDDSPSGIYYLKDVSRYLRATDLAARGAFITSDRWLESAELIRS